MPVSRASVLFDAAQLAVLQEFKEELDSRPDISLQVAGQNDTALYAGYPKEFVLESHLSGVDLSEVQYEVTDPRCSGLIRRPRRFLPGRCPIKDTVVKGAGLRDGSGHQGGFQRTGSYS